MSGRNDFTFDDWLDTFVAEKGLDTERIFEAEGASGLNIIPLAVVLEHLKIAPPAEQEAIRTVIVKIDFANGDVTHFFGHLAKALAQ